MNDLKVVTGFDGIPFDKERMEYYTRYFTEYYHDGFRSGQGTEVVLDVLKKYGQAGTWLDIGAGPATLFWSLMLPKMKELHCSEMYIEGLKVLDDFIRSDMVPQCYKDVMQMHGIAPEHLASMRAIPRSYFLFNALQEWPSGLPKESYDLITAFGVFGLSKTPEAYRESFSYMKPFLKPGAIAIGANWIRSQHFIDKNGGDNRYLQPELVEKSARDYGYEIQHLSREQIAGDENYDGVLVWALRKSF